MGKETRSLDQTHSAPSAAPSQASEQTQKINSCTETPVREVGQVLCLPPGRRASAKPRAPHAAWSRGSNASSRHSRGWEGRQTGSRSRGPLFPTLTSRQLLPLCEGAFLPPPGTSVAPQRSGISWDSISSRRTATSGGES